MAVQRVVTYYYNFYYRYLAESGAHQVGGICPFDVTAFLASLTGPTNAFRTPNLALEGFKIGRSSLRLASFVN